MVTDVSPWHRLWLRLGFGWPQPRTSWPDDDEERHWYFGTTVITHWPWSDILRLMISRRSVCRVAHRTEVDVGAIRTSSAVAVIPPGYDVRRQKSTIPERSDA